MRIEKHVARIIPYKDKHAHACAKLISSNLSLDFSIPPQERAELLAKNTPEHIQEHSNTAHYFLAVSGILRKRLAGVGILEENGAVRVYMDNEHKGNEHTLVSYLCNQAKEKEVKEVTLHTPVEEETLTELGFNKEKNMWKKSLL